MPPLPLRRLLPLDIIDRHNDLPPHCRAVKIALVEHGGIGFHRSLDSSRDMLPERRAASPMASLEKCRGRLSKLG